MTYRILLFFVLLPSLVSGQNHTFDSSQPTTITKEITRETGKVYEVIITLPPDYQANKEYQVLYYLDAWWLRDLVQGCYRIKSLSNKSLANNMEELILVGISSVGNEEDWNRQRNMDFTPSKYNGKLVVNFGKIQLHESTTGGADSFLTFLKDEVFTMVESEYKISKSKRGILGHSYGGLLGFYAYKTHPEMFSNYILLAPSIWWNQSCWSSRRFEFFCAN